jgi:hypothetical protein
MTAMDAEPFLTLRLRSCRDLILARHRARQIAELLRFPAEEVICIAAGAFVVAEQSKRLVPRGTICFAIVDHQLRVFGRPARALAQLPSNLYILSKPLPRDDQQLASEDIAWLVREVGELAPATPQEEVLRQNQEILLLLTKLRGGQTSCDPALNPMAA